MSQGAAGLAGQALCLKCSVCTLSHGRGAAPGRDSAQRRRGGSTRVRHTPRVMHPLVSIALWFDRGGHYLWYGPLHYQALIILAVRC